MTEFKIIQGRIVNKLFLLVWPPWGEEKQIDFDISFGFVFNDEPNRLCIIKVDKNELWQPHISYETLPQDVYSWEDFCPRMNEWMNAKEDTNMIIKYEYYDVTGWGVFHNIVDSEIIRIEQIWIEGIPDPFGVKLLFKDDYIISIPNSDGNMVETKMFNNSNGIDKFKHLGNVVYSEL